MPVLVRIVLWIVGIWLFLCIGAWLLQRKFQYFPDRSPVEPPPGDRWRGLRPVTLQAADGVKLEAFHWPGQSELTILLLHGNAGHRGHRLEWMADLHDLGWSIFLLDYRGYGGSEGSPTEAGLALDADAAVDWLETNGVGRHVYLGSSIGCGVATALAARRPPAGLVLQSGAVSLKHVAQRAYPFLPMGLLMKDTFDVEDDAGEVTCPALVIHGDLDEVVSMDLGRRLHDALAGPRTWYVVEGAGHNDLVAVGGLDYLERVHSFLTSLDP